MKSDSSCTGDEMLTRALAGETAAFGGLVRRHQAMVCSLALRMLNDRHLAQDLAQEVFLQLHRKLADVQSDAHLFFWLRKVTVNRAIDQLRREPRLEQASLEEAMTLAGEEGREVDPLIQRRLRTLVSRLAPAARAVVLLRYQEDLQPTEIARVLKMSLNTVKSHLKRSLATLRAQIGETTLEQTLT